MTRTTFLKLSLLISTSDFEVENYLKKYFTLFCRMFSLTLPGEKIIL
jgi:hypothetical protein